MAKRKPKPVGGISAETARVEKAAAEATELARAPEPDAVGATTDSGEEPVIKGMPKTFPAFTTMRVPGGWAFIELTIDNNLNVLGVKPTQPNVKAVIQEQFKIQVGKYWQKLEG